MKIYLIGKPAIDEKQLRLFLKDEGKDWQRTPSTNNCEDIVEFAGRICHMSFGKRQLTGSNHVFIEKLIAKQHESVLEHASWTFIATGITRSLSHQIVRHRIGFSFSQMSQQYYDASPPEIIVPSVLSRNEKLMKELDRIKEVSKNAYSNIKKIIKEEQVKSTANKEIGFNKGNDKFMRSAARSVLPNCTETKLVFSANGRSIRHFLKLRGNIAWDIEMRLFCHELLLIMKQEAPNIFSDFTIHTHDDDYPIILHDKKVNPNV